MATRLSAIATRTGDDGTTGLGDGTRIRKDSLRIQALGEVDELNSVIGVVLTQAMPDDIRAALLKIQNDLFDLGGEVCIPGYENIRDTQVAQLDAWLAHYNDDLPRLQEFILPGGCLAAAHAHVARTVCRRAERAMVALSVAEPVRDLPRHYLNRLSDLLFVLARCLNRAADEPDVQWKR